MTRYFGTDGIRGIANKDLTPELAFEVGRAGAFILTHGKKGKILIGKDTRVSGDMLEASLIAGITSMGLDVVTLGVIPTPAIAYLTREYKAIAGIMISASHNPGEYNGIKFFNKDGLKLPDEVEEEIEEILNKEKEVDLRPIGADIGRVYVEENGAKDYKEFLKKSINIDLKGIKVAMDCGNGALSKIGPEIIKELNGEVVYVNISPDGMNINKDCGSTNPKIIQELVIREKADIGVSFDGDADRIIAVDEKGKIIDGDHILAICATHLKENGKLNNDTVVGTIMTNMGLDIYLKEMGMNIVKTTVGDRYVLEEMLQSDFVLGGEQSGHIIFLQYNTTGDGLATALHLLEVLRASGKTMSELSDVMKDYPQILINAKVNNEKKYKYLEDIQIKEEIERIEKQFHGKGRVVIRPSGTEPLVRVMIEGENQEEITSIAKDLALLIERKLKN
ncbi:phosphoglucosamine mutase [Tissierella creatinophila]|uniref:Phosphoglucosamine mutase n=1 Tax=Tissierella creatinophila DSM 6911 TaxID=1123403 RepID=A0A1U7M421_TISCR|nr:phosphoglucosamine mutase [Tissierella creatinophila]OLS02063.1 phosphoglucosamine mutase [Tissierella creatinophila DSM 6911]